MSLLDQLRARAHAIEAQRNQTHVGLTQNIDNVERAMRMVDGYLRELARQLIVIQPDGPPFSLDGGRTPWPKMKLCEFRTDTRKKLLDRKEVFDYCAIAWQAIPQIGGVVRGVVTVPSFPPAETERMESRLLLGSIRHERQEVRDPERYVLKEVRYHYSTETRGSVVVTADHASGSVVFRLANVVGFETTNSRWPAHRIATDVLDDLTHLVLSQPSRFV